MNLKSSLVLLTAAVVLFGYIVLFERHIPDPTQRAETADRLFPQVDPAAIDRVEVVLPNHVIRAERVDGRWRLIDPVYPAQPYFIEQWIEALRQSTRRITLTASEVLEQGADLPAFGLEPGQALVQVRQSGERPHQLHFRLGFRTPVGDRLYLQMVGSSDVHVTESTLLDLLPRSASDWRDHSFVDLAGLPFNRMRVTAGGREFEVEFVAAKQRWRLNRPRPARADATRIERALQQLQALAVERFVQDSPGADLEPFGLHEPALALSLQQGTNELFWAQFGRSPTSSPGSVYARRSDYPNIVLLSRAAVDTLAVPYTQFLDYRLVDQSIDRADRIEVRATDEFVVERQATGGWRVTEPHEFAADPALVQGFMKRFESLRIAEVAKEVVTELDLPSYGLDTPAWQYRFLVSQPVPAEPECLVQLDFGARQNDRVFVRRLDENPVYLTPLDEALFLPRAAFELRDRRLWDFSTNQVESVTIQLRQKDYKLLRTNTGTWSFAPGFQGIVNTFALEEAVYQFGQLRARAWVEQNPTDTEFYGIPQLDHRLEIQLNEAAGGQRYRIAFGARSPSGGPFGLVEIEGGPTVFEVPFEISHVYEDVIRSLALRPDAAP